MSAAPGRLQVRCADGPLADQTFLVTSCPRLVRCVRAVGGRTDILNLPEDRPTPAEEVFWYRWDGRPAAHFRNRRGSSITAVTLRHAPNVRDLEDGRRERQLAIALDDADQAEKRAKRRERELALERAIGERQFAEASLR